MGFLGSAHAWRGAIFACGLAWLAPTAGAGAVDSPGAPELAFETCPAAAVVAASVTASMAASIATLMTASDPSSEHADEPFGVTTTIVVGGGLRAKWLGVADRIDSERVQLALCDGDRARCASYAALKLLTIVDDARTRDGRARIGEINRAINLAIRPMSDLAQHGEIDVWSSPLATLASGAGDCEDYAIAKFVALRLAGMAAQDLRIVVMRDLIQGEDHAVAAARLDGHWLMLDNRRMAMIEERHVRHYRPLFVLDESAVMKYAEMPLLAGMPDGEPLPAIPTNSPVAQ
jgi:predicted transglutaminase-like cysteine proteinase